MNGTLGDRALPAVSMEGRDGVPSPSAAGGGTPALPGCGGESKVWLVIHSGARNLGKRIEEHYHQIAHRLCTRDYSPRADALGFWLLPLSWLASIIVLFEKELAEARMGLRVAAASGYLDAGRLAPLVDESLPLSRTLGAGVTTTRRRLREQGEALE